MRFFIGVVSTVVIPLVAYFCSTLIHYLLEMGEGVRQNSTLFIPKNWWGVVVLLKQHCSISGEGITSMSNFDVMFV